VQYGVLDAQHTTAALAHPSGMSALCVKWHDADLNYSNKIKLLSAK
jgi:hypothetical protein